MTRALLAPAPPRDNRARSRPPTFSVLIAAYQAAAFIGEAVQSVLTQTLAPLEIIVCDDGSTDGTGEALEPYRGRIVYVRQDNRGAGAAKAAAARLARGEFVVVLDADDIFLPERLEALGQAAVARPDLDIINADAYIVHEGRVLRRAYDETWPFEVEDQRRGILERCFVLGHAAVRRTTYEAAGGYDETLRAVVDWDLWLRAILGGARAGFVAEPLSEYRVRPGSVSSDRTEVLRSGLRVLQRIAARDDLSRSERATLGRTLGAWSRDLELAEARHALIAREPGLRRRLARVIFGRQYPVTTRLRTSASFLFPHLAARILAERERTSAVGAAGVRLSERCVED